jgi:peptidoglycan glycosyltransferase
MALAAIAFLVGAVVGTGHRGSAGQRLSEQFVSAWTRGDYATMYDDIDPVERRRVSASRFEAAYKQAARTATQSGLEVMGRARNESGEFVLPMRVQTRLWGALTENLRLPIASTAQGARVSWSHALVFPGLRAGESLSRNMTLPPRATLLARDGTVLAEGQASGAGARESPLGGAAAAVVGEVGPVPEQRRGELEAQGVPARAIVGTSGLELALDGRLRGRPGGELLAGDRVLAGTAAKAGPPVRTTISPGLQRVATEALGGQFGGVVALDPASGEILAVAGIGIDDLQPPGSTFKMVTLSAALEAKVASQKSVFQYATYATLDGVKLENANGESCGGSLALPVPRYQSCRRRRLPEWPPRSLCLRARHRSSGASPCAPWRR